MIRNVVPFACGTNDDRHKRLGRSRVGPVGPGLVSPFASFSALWGKGILESARLVERDGDCGDGGMWCVA